MQTILGAISVLFVCGTALGLAFMILLSLPQSRMRAVCLEIVSWLLAIFCGIYCLSPFDILPEALMGPFGLLDDGGALIGGIAAAIMAWRAKGEKQQFAAK